jgi:hypothetical protein
MMGTTSARQELLPAVAELRRGIDAFHLRVPVVAQFARVVRAAGMARPDAEALSLAVSQLVLGLDTAGVAAARTPLLLNPLRRMAEALDVPLEAFGI